ncbi:MAG TPA: 2-dehydropantoate 2-reductase [Bacteroidales bacterium]|nr:2-dehydropantoate 2-reductase [Bacteroidales bacterium]
MNIAVIGAGGVGGYFGGRLAQAGHHVTFVARGQHLKAISENGLIVKSIKGDFTVKPAVVTDKIGELVRPELVILGLKAWQIKETALELKAVVGENTTVLPLQNGVMAAEELVSVLNSKNVVAGLCRIFSKIEAPGIINHFGIEPEIVFGELNNEITPRLNKITEALKAADIKATATADIQTELWKKLMIIGSGGLLALTRSPYGAVRENKETRQLMQSLLTEIRQVSLKAGAQIEPDYVDKTMKYIDAYPYDSTTSLARDIWAEKPSEIEYQNGSVVMLGERYGVATPVNRFVYHCLLPMERKARKER